MSTPNFLPQDDTNYSAVRFYTAVDPYFYTVDNRPLQDLEANLKAARSGGGDSARRAAALLSLNLASVASELFTSRGQNAALSGLQVYNTGSNTIRIGPGAYYELRNINASITDQAFKQALLATHADFTLTPPTTAGTSIVYTVEGQFVELIDTTMPTSTLPYLDASNQYLPSILINGELKLSLTSGVAATTGTQTPAVTTAGKFPIYNITVTQGSSNYVVQLHNNAPRPRSLSSVSSVNALSTGGATVAVNANEVMAYSFADGAISGVNLTRLLNTKEINPYLPISLKITFSSSATGGNVAFRIRYKGFATGDTISGASNISSTEAMPVSGNVNSVQTYQTTISVPVTEFAGFVGNTWKISKEFLNIVFERLGADVLDTNTGTLNVLNFTLSQ